MGPKMGLAGVRGGRGRNLEGGPKKRRLGQKEAFGGVALGRGPKSGGRAKKCRLEGSH